MLLLLRSTNVDQQAEFAEFNHSSDQMLKMIKNMNNMIGKKTIWTLSMAVCILVAIAVVRANEVKTDPVFSLDHSPITRAEGANALSYSSVVKKVRPSIVSISTSKTVQVSNNIFEFGDGMSPFGDDIFRRFFGDRGFSQPQQREPQKQKRTGLGSGVIVTKDGYILTNNHVVEDGDEIKVTLNGDDKEYDAKLIGGDPRSDIAILKIEANDLPEAVLGDSDNVEDGDVVLAFGNPFGVGQTVTMGIVSATGRNNLGIEEYENFIQTDAAINPGNSGGALTDAQGRVIGINTAIYSRSGGYQGLGFAIPINMAEGIMKQIIKTGKVTRGYLGVTLQKLTDDVIESFDLKGKSGALIADVSEGSAADKAGLKRGDVIIAINGKDAKDNGTLALLVANLAPGETATVRIIRNGSEMDIPVVLDEWPEGLTRYGASNNTTNVATGIKGVNVKNLTSDLRKDAQIPEKVDGVLVTEVDVESNAYEKGLRVGDIIQECNDRPIKDINDLKKAVAANNKAKHKLVIYSKNSTRFVFIDK